MEPVEELLRAAVIAAIDGNPERAEESLRKIDFGYLTTERSKTVGGIESAQDGIRAVSESRYPGKVVIFPQLSGLPLTEVTELAVKYPEVGARLAPGHVWTPEAEQALIERFWQP